MNSISLDVAMSVIFYGLRVTVPVESSASSTFCLTPTKMALE